MKKILFLISMFSCAITHAQNMQTIVIKASDNLTDQQIKNLVYKYPSFLPGKVYFENGDSAGGRMNYNLFIGSFQFIDARGDTLMIVNPDSIKLVTIDADHYCYENKEFLQIIQEFSGCKLGVRQYIKVADKRKNGAFGVSSLARIESEDAIRDYQNYRLMINEELILTSGLFYYVGDEKNNFLIANRNSLKKLFPKKKKQIEEYLESNNVNFQNEKALKDLLAYISNKE